MKSLMLMISMVVMGCAVGVGEGEPQKESSGPAVGSLSSAAAPVDTTSYDPNNCLLTVVQTMNGPELVPICYGHHWIPQDAVDPPNQPDPSPDHVQQLQKVGQER